MVEPIETGIGNTLTMPAIKKKSINKQDIQRKNWFFTEKAKLIKSDLESQLEKIETTLLCICKKFIFQVEKGGKSNYLHIQGCIILTKKMRFSQVKNILSNDCHWEATKNQIDADFYCSKNETRVMNYKQYIYPQKETIEKVIIEKLYKWQLEILEILKKKPDQRKIYWFWSNKGCKGKSTFATYILDNIEERTLIFEDNKKGDIYYAFSNGSKNKDGSNNDNYRSPKIVIIDLPRNESNNANYVALECLKNGRFLSTKYKSRMVRFNIPHVFVFANKPPTFSKLSADKWVVKNVDQCESIDTLNNEIE